MEATEVGLIENLFYKKIMLYNDLLYYFKQERESLINIDLDKLWSISKEKEKICTQISATRHKILAAVDLQEDEKSFNLSRIMNLIPRELRADFQKLYLRLIKLKSEIEFLRKENTAFIDDSLQFLDEMISIITGGDKSEIAYNHKCHFRKSSPYFLLSREV
ncbi:MAG: flagellar protein FlgN [Pseudomonadota bacterium]|uniref:Flagellar export chaperone FlgN n=1 Tax=Candidatus Desulfatibia profunda TaxID=2841695 RepID=A0A8J6NTB3_9BACT|nr:flagellar export chaperone FlgN [Candidatus Desulfatibia profunda]MBL7179795.1 flagellar export chaperone FlgN [Desulfobacterales bacterium]